MKTIQSKTIIFIHGAFVHVSGWDHWRSYFESKGYQTYAPAWPYKSDTPTELRRQHPNGNIPSLRLKQVVEHYAETIQRLPEKPIAIGHSLGGLITQIMVNRDLVSAGCCLHPVPPQGVIPYEFSFLKSGWKSLGVFSSLNKSYLMSLSDWQYAFTNGMTPEDQKASYDLSVVPESKRIARDGLTSAAHVDFNKTHPLLLLISGSKDHIMPASLTRRIYKRYNKKNGSVTDYKHYEGTNHYVVGLPGWKVQADYILDWIRTH